MLTSKPVTWLKPDPNQPRKAYDPDDLGRLGASLKKKQLVPLLARSKGWIIDGERRWRAAALVGLTHLDVIVTDENLTLSEIRERQLVTALHRSGLSPYEQYCGFAEWLRENPQTTARELAEKIDRDPALLARSLSLLKCVPAVVKAAEEGKITPAHWYPISQQPPERQEALLNLKLAGQASREDLMAAGRQRRDPKPEKPAKIVCSLPSQIRVTVSGKGVTLDDGIQALTQALKEMEAARRLGYSAKTFAAATREKSKKAVPA